MTQKRQTLDFEPLVIEDDSPIEVPVTIGKYEYVLKEISSPAEYAAKKYVADGYKEITRRKRGRVEIDFDSSIARERMLKSDMILLSHCLYRKSEGDTLTPVPFEVIENWTDRVFRTVLLKLYEISGRDENGEPLNPEAAEDDPKGGPKSSETGSDSSEPSSQD